MKIGKYVALSSFSVFTHNTIIVYYDTHLVVGNTLLCKSTNTSIIFRCLSTAVDLSHPTQTMNFTIDIMNNKPKLITDILHESKRWESMHNRGGPVTTDIVYYLIDKCAQSHPNNRYTITADWFILDLQAGFKRMEWNQDRTYFSKYNTYQRSIDGSSSSSLKSDFKFRGHKGKPLNHKNIIIIDNASTVRLTWRYQQN